MPDDNNQATSLLQLPEENLKERFIASLVDDEGREVPITPDMVRSACQKLQEAAITGLHCPLPRDPAT